MITPQSEGYITLTTTSGTQDDDGDRDDEHAREKGRQRSDPRTTKSRVSESR